MVSRFNPRSLIYLFVSLLAACSTAPQPTTTGFPTPVGANQQSPLPPTPAETSLASVASETPNISPQATPTLRPTKIPIPDIFELLEASKLEIQASGASIDEVTVKLRNLTEEALELSISAGIYFASENSGFQDMVTRSTIEVRLEASAELNVDLPAACASLFLDIPSEQIAFSEFFSLPDESELARLMAVIDENEPPFAVGQAAVWIITDNASYDDLGRLVKGAIFGAGGDRMIEHEEASQAMQLIEQAGIEIRSKRIWEDLGTGNSELEDSPGQQSEAQTTAEVGKVGRSFFDGNGITSFAWSPDSSLLATSICLGQRGICEAGYLKVWNPFTGELVRQFGEMYSGGVWSVAWSPDGSRIAAGHCMEDIVIGEFYPQYCRPAAITLFDVESGTALQQFDAGDGWARPLVFSPDGARLLSGACAEIDYICTSAEVRSWQVSSGKALSTLSGFPWEITDLAFSSDGTLLAVPAETEIWIWDLASGELAQKLGDYPNTVTRLDWSSKNVLATKTCAEIVDQQCASSQISLIDANSQNTLGEYPVEEKWIQDLAWNPEGSRLVLSLCYEFTERRCRRGRITLWEVEPGTRIGEYAASAQSLAFSPDGKLLGMLNQDGVLTLTDTNQW